MSSTFLNINKAYETICQEQGIDNLEVEGTIPDWLSGSLVANGPAQFEVGELHLNHWFDGLAMLKKFSFASGKVSFQNRFIRSNQFKSSHAKHSLNTNEFGSYTNKSIIKRIGQSAKEIFQQRAYDNCNINTAHISNHFIAMTESNEAIEFDIKNLETVGHFQYLDDIRGHLTTAHPHWDPIRQETINIVIELGVKNKYHIYKLDPNTTKRELITTYISDTLFYIHSFSVTPNYIILFKSPLVINKLKLMLRYPFNDTLSWQEHSSFFVMIDRRNKAISEIETAGFSCLHSANAFERKDEVIIDIISHENGNPYNYFELANLKNEHPRLPTGTLQRFCLDVQKKRCDNQVISNSNQEFPRINYLEQNGLEYNYLYSCALTDPQDKFLNSIEKTNMNTGNVLRWQKANTYPGEAIFVKNPAGAAEDDGLLLSIVFNASTECSSLIILNARDIQQMAEVSLPFPLPFGLHGNFYPDRF